MPSYRHDGFCRYVIAAGSLSERAHADLGPLNGQSADKKVGTLPRSLPGRAHWEGAGIQHHTALSVLDGDMAQYVHDNT